MDRLAAVSTAAALLAVVVAQGHGISFLAILILYGNDGEWGWSLRLLRVACLALIVPAVIPSRSAPVRCIARLTGILLPVPAWYSVVAESHGVATLWCAPFFASFVFFAYFAVAASLSERRSEKLTTAGLLYCVSGSAALLGAWLSKSGFFACIVLTVVLASVTSGSKMGNR